MRRLLLLLLVPVAFAHSDEGIVFPEWTYWVEIVEHAAMLVVSLAAAVLLARHGGGARKFAVAGFGIFALAEVLTILQHFLIYPFGVWSAIVGHGLLLAALAVIAYGAAKPGKG